MYYHVHIDGTRFVCRAESEDAAMRQLQRHILRQGEPQLVAEYRTAGGAFAFTHPKEEED